MRIIINGDAETVDDGAAISDLLDKFGLTPQRVAVEVNEALVPRAGFPDTCLHEGDRVEIVTLVGGG